MSTHLKTKRCLISASALELIKGECFVVAYAGAGQAEVIIIKQWPAHPRKVLGPSAQAGLWLL